MRWQRRTPQRLIERGCGKLDMAIRKGGIFPTSGEDDFLRHTFLESVVAVVAVPQLAPVMVDY